MKTPVLDTPRLILRPVTPEDAPAIQKYINNWNIAKSLSMEFPWPYPDDGAECFVRNSALPRMGTGEAMIWVIVPKEGPDEAIGVIDLRIDGGAGAAGQRGFWLAEPFWNRGYMTEAVAAVQDYYFLELGRESLIVSNAKSNGASRRMKEKAGAKFLGEFDFPHHSGETLSEKWEITREGWMAARKNSPSPS